MVEPVDRDDVGEMKGLRDDVYRRPLATALSRLGLGAGWRCVDVGAGGGDVSVALAEMVGRDGRVYAVDSDPAARDEVAHAAAAHAQVIALTQAGEDLSSARGGRPRLLPLPPPARARAGGRRAQDGRRGPPRRLGGGAGADHVGRPHRGDAAVDARRAPPRRRRAAPRRSCATPGSRSSTPGPRRRRASGPVPSRATWNRSRALIPATTRWSFPAGDGHRPPRLNATPGGNGCTLVSH